MSAAGQTEDEVGACPFCGYQAREQYKLLLHMEESHAEGDSPFVAVAHSPTRPSAHDYGDEEYIPCPIEGCEEALLAREISDHVEMHAQIDVAEGVSSSSSPPSSSSSPVPVSPSSEEDAARKARLASRAGDNVSSKQAAQDLQQRPEKRHHSQVSSSPTSKSHRNRHAVSFWRNILLMPGGRAHTAQDTQGTPEETQMLTKTRLGKAELGKHAHEKRMPDWLVSHLKDGWGIKGSGIIPVLEQLLEQSASTKYAYLCHPCVVHVSKLRREGGFCGYRNVQMLLSYVLAAEFPGSQHLKGELPSIFQIQDWIEEAWDRGINAHGRIETGGVKGTRKYIGTQEAQAVFIQLGIPCEARSFKDKAPGRSQAHLLRDAEMYFESGRFDPGAKVRQTSLPPIYWQHAGHSMTIIGFEKLNDGGINLLVFDPMFRDARFTTKLVDRVFEHRLPDILLKPYRKGANYLSKYHEFELLKLRPRPNDLLA